MKDVCKADKLFVLDTNVILHDSSCLYQFDKHDIVVPIPVLEELDQFKKGNSVLNFHAREFVRALDRLSSDKLFNGGVRIAEGSGRISIKLEREMHPDIKVNFPDLKPDHHLLNIAYFLSLERPDQKIILVTKDVNLRMKARSLGISSEDYKTDQVKDLSSLYKGYRIINDLPDTLFDMLFDRDAPHVPGDMLPAAFPRDMKDNEYCILKNCNRSALALFNMSRHCIRRVEKGNACGIVPKNAEQSFALDALLNKDIPLISITGKAGTGKTLLALAAAVKQRRAYRQIFMARPVVPLSNKDLGYLPGDVQAKLDPYMQPLFDNLGVIQMTEDNATGRSINEMLEEKKISIAPLAYIRGRSLVKIIFIVDEAQNLTPHEVKTIITRAGEGTKIVFTGDIFQIDHPYLDSRSNGLSYLIEKMQGESLYAHINLEKGERSELSELASNLL